MRRTPIPAGLDSALERAVEQYPAGALSALARRSLDAAGRLPLAIKYVPVKWAKTYAKSGAAQLKVSTTLGFTWGTGTYVAPTASPISTAIYGRVGVVAEFDPSGWRVFDATKPSAQALYLEWFRFQPLHRVLALTMHSALANQFLRDLFRITYRIDCVLFHPDQGNAVYTDPRDTWMNVTDWTTPLKKDDTLREIDSTFSKRLMNPRLSVLVEEEFESVANDVGRDTLIGPLSSRPANSAMQRTIARAYASGTPVRLLA